MGEKTPNGYPGLNDPGWVVVPHFKHLAGGHCESTSLTGNLRSIGFDYSEPFVFGLDASIGFSFWGFDRFKAQKANIAQYEMVVGGKQGFFSEKSLACRLLGVIVDKKDFSRGTEAWEDAKRMVDAGKGLLLQVDMGYLPYFEEATLESDDGFHFGGHFINQIGYHKNNEFGLIVDNNKAEPCVVPRSLLERARGSIFGPKFMMPHNIRYVLSRRPDGKHPPIGAAVRFALQQAMKNMLAASISQLGFAALKGFLGSIPKWHTDIGQDLPKMKALADNLYAYIEEYGTGGAIFRDLYSKFIAEILEMPDLRQGVGAWAEKDLQQLRELSVFLQESRAGWHQFSQILKKISKEPGQTELIKELENTGETILSNERSFWNGLKPLVG